MDDDWRSCLPSYRSWGHSLCASTGKQRGDLPIRWTSDPLDECWRPGIPVRRQQPYALRPDTDRGAVYQYQGTPGQWEAIGGPASQIVAGGPFLFALTPNNDSIWRYEGQPFAWTKIGGPGHSFASCDAGLFGLNPDKTGVFWHVGPPDEWICVGTAAGSIAAGGSHLYAMSPTFQGVYVLE